MAKSLALAIPGCRLENRGGRTLASLISKARHFHFDRICTIYEEKGKPHEIAFMEIGEESGWGWLSPRIKINRVSFPRKPFAKIRQSNRLQISGPRARILAYLLSPRNSSDEAESMIASSSNKLSILVANKKLLGLGVRYEK